MSRRKQDRPQHLAKANATEDPATEMSSHDVGRIEGSTESEAFGARETSPGTSGTETERGFPEDPLDDQNPRNEDSDPCDQENQEDTLPDEDSYDSAMSHDDDDSLKMQTALNVGECSFDLPPLNFKHPNPGKQPRSKNPLAESRHPGLKVEHDLEDDARLRLVDYKGTDSCGGDQIMGGEGQTSSNLRRPSNPGSSSINTESHVNKLQSFVDSLAKLTEPSYVARPQPPFHPQYPKATPARASGCIGSFSSSSRFPYFGYQSPTDERGLATTPVVFLSPPEQPLDLSTKKQHSGFTNEDSSDVASPGVHKRCLERGSERRQRPTYDVGNQSSRPVWYEFDHATSARSSSFTAGQVSRMLPQDKHRGSDAGKYKREQQTVGSFGEMAASKAQTYKKSEIVNRKEIQQHRPTDASQRSSATEKGKYSTFDEGSAQERREQSPGSEAIQNQRCQRQSAKGSGENSHERGEPSTPRKEERGYMNMKCSCGIRFESLYQLAIHIERSGHVPGSLRPESLADLPKLVRGQDVWMSQGPEQAELILRCVQCGTSFRSLPELTFHMIRTKHYVNIVGGDGSAAGQMDYGDPPREKESPQRGGLKGSRRKNDMPPVSERSMEVTEQRLQKNNKSPRHNDEESDAMSQIQSAYSGRHHQFNLQSLFSGRGSTKGVSEAEHESRQCQENDANKKQMPVVPDEISEKEPVDSEAVSLDESKEVSRTEIRDRGDQSLRRHSLASKLHSKISSVTSNIQERIGSSQSASNSVYKTASQGNSKSKSRVLKDACEVAEKVSDAGVARSSTEKHSSTDVPKIQSPDRKDAVKLIEPNCEISGSNDGNRRHKRPRDNDYENENDGTEKRIRTSCRPGHQPSKDPNSTRCQVRERFSSSAQDIRKERLLQNVSRWIASTELETKRDCSDETQIEHLDPMLDNRLELVSPPPQPVETSSILVAIKNFVDSSFCGQTFASGSHPSNQTIFSSFAGRIPVPTGRNFSEMNYNTMNLTPGAADTCESPSRSSPMKRKRHLDVLEPHPSERKQPMRSEGEDQSVLFSYVEDSSCKPPLTVAFCGTSKVNTEPSFEEDDPELQSISDPTASPFRNRKPEFSDLIDMKRLEGLAPRSESLLFDRRCSRSETEVDMKSRDDAIAVQPVPFPLSNPNEDSSDTVELEECLPPAQTALEITSADTVNLAVDSTTKSPKPVGIVPTAYAIPDDPLRDCSSDRKSISKPISFFLSARSFETVC